MPEILRDQDMPAGVVESSCRLQHQDKALKQPVVSQTHHSHTRYADCGNLAVTTTYSVRSITSLCDLLRRVKNALPQMSLLKVGS